MGGGQLGRFLAMQARDWGMEVYVFCPDEHSPAARLANRHFKADYQDLEALREFASMVSGVTYEFENIPPESIRFLSQHIITAPAALALETSQNRKREKLFLNKIGNETAPFALIETQEDIEAAQSGSLIPGVLKTAAFGYDGKGQIKVESADALAAAWLELDQQPCVLEGWVNFEKEVSILSARDFAGNLVHYPLIQNTHKNHILDLSLFPMAGWNEDLQQQAEEMSSRLLTELDYVGLLCVEFFLLPSGKLVVNEFAPRPHNSGHLTLDSHNVSQFEQQLRCLTGHIVGGNHTTYPNAVMLNLIGEDFSQFVKVAHRLSHDYPHLHIHLYGKDRVMPGRKMGHLTLVGDDLNRLQEEIETIRTLINEA